jgi:hypothetical protein
LSARDRSDHLVACDGDDGNASCDVITL